ncbi:MAG: glycosyltransferase family 39 protein [Fibrobacter sp.]|uniref:ArnT family glycosyltransferase n=1 Tax=Fibrobacter sp. TaxID=35828 RepID=UPI0025B9341F|nr:glycosyltransferase family 39 protein [Fibrobacter sp.]MBR4783840.1 glycosyltransferase family 39 protein [Fibrobacter sp.]
MILSLWGMLEFFPKIENVRLVRDTATQESSFPLLMKMEKGERFSVEFDVKSRLSNYDLNIIPDDCAEIVIVNGSMVDLNHIQGNCNFAKGFVLRDSVTAPYKVGDKTHYSFYLINNGGDAGLNVLVKQASVLPIVLYVLIVLSLASLCLLLARRFGLGWGLAFIIFAAVVLRMVFFINASYKTFSYDVEGHIGYVQYIIENRSIPGVDDCWTCYHPPVYYVAAVPSYLIGEWIGLPGTAGLQAFSLLLSILTLFFGMLFLRNFFSGKALGIASALWAFWPVMILVSPRIGNDQMFYMLHMLCMWCGMKYIRDGRGRFLIVAVIATALAMWTKATGFVTLGTLVLFMAWGYWVNVRGRKFRCSELVAAGMFLALVVAVVLQHLLGDNGLVGNSGGLNGQLRVGSEAFNYIFFDLKNFVTSPFTSAWNDDFGRVYFWNYAFKTSLFGEFEMLRSVVGRNFATLLSCSFLGLVVYALRGFWRTKLQMVHWFLLLQGTAFVAALMFLRIRHSFACSNDFRYILPVIICFVPFVAQGITCEGASLKWKVLGYALVSAFVVCTAILLILAM